MKHFALGNNPLSFNGSAIKRILPNTMEFPKIDILIRESIQNSFDALKPDEKSLRYSFTHSHFNTRSFSAELDDMEERINVMYPDRECDFIEIRDRNTKGLCGSVYFSEDSEDWGNFIRLVFAIANEQAGEEKGGSWGYGKTNYYSVGNGIVIYYTQTEFEGRLEQRLIIAMVENNRKGSPMIYPEAKLGISYWGTDIKGENNVIPCTDPVEIARFLDIFGLKPFEEGETGTSVIIPFVNSNNLYLASANLIMDESNIQPYSESLFEFFVKLAVQRWYFPRLSNEESDRHLIFEYNGEKFVKESMSPLFKKLQEIYNETITKPSYITLSQAVFRGKETKVAAYSSRIIRIDSVINPYNMTIYQMLGFKNNVRPNAAIGFRCRSLGMINRYDIDSAFVSNVEDYDPFQTQIVALRPLPDVSLFNPADNKTQLITLEGYIRKGEDPSHSVWQDSFLSDIGGDETPSRLRVIQQLIQKLRHVFEKKESIQEKNQKRNLAISRSVGKLLLPNVGFGTGATTGGTSGGSGGHGGGGGGKPKAPEPITYDTPIRRNSGNKISIQFPFETDKKNTDFSIYLTPCVEDVRTIDEWEKVCGIPFPMSIESFKVISINEKRPSGDVSICDDGSIKFDEVSVKTHLHNGKVVALSIAHPSEISKIGMELIFDQTSCKFKTNIEVKEGRYE